MSNMLRELGSIPRLLWSLLCEWGASFRGGFSELEEAATVAVLNGLWVKCSCSHLVQKQIQNCQKSSHTEDTAQCGELRGTGLGHHGVP